jgi:hypothetical protein
MGEISRDGMPLIPYSPFALIIKENRGIGEGGKKE